MVISVWMGGGGGAVKQRILGYRCSPHDTGYMVIALPSSIQTSTECYLRGPLRHWPHPPPIHWYACQWTQCVILWASVLFGRPQSMPNRCRKNDIFQGYAEYCDACVLWFAGRPRETNTFCLFLDTGSDSNTPDKYCRLIACTLCSDYPDEAGRAHLHVVPLGYGLMIAGAYTVGGARYARPCCRNVQSRWQSFWQQL